jgi:hypothetical protein
MNTPYTLFPAISQSYLSTSRAKRGETSQDFFEFGAALEQLAERKHMKAKQKSPEDFATAVEREDE